MQSVGHHSQSVFPCFPQRTFIFTFLLSSRLFIRPHELMSKVCLLCTEQQRLGDPQADKVRSQNHNTHHTTTHTHWR